MSEMLHWFVRRQKFQRNFPLGDKSRLQQWLVNIRRDKWKPNPSSRLCSVHFEDNCFYTSNLGKVRLTTSAVPTIFSFPKHMQKKPPHTRRRLERRGDVVLRNVEAVEEIVRVVVDESNGASEIRPGSYSHLPCHPSVPSDTVCHSKDHTYYMAEFPETLQNSFNLAKAELTNYRKRLKLQSARIRRLKKKVTSLSAIVSKLRQERRL
ncbi:THAP domain-containing protein 3-like isoform X2 [Siphateles boraxobius]|uniref:THAP domain-containing protein 3-like isoform X2 n=1 Tax=Siphateles boraxobius TaxID=180520 RepID=UPI004064BBE4